MKPRKRDVVISKVASQVTKRMTKDQRIIRGILGERQSRIPKKILAVATPIVYKSAVKKLHNPKSRTRITIGTYEDEQIGIVVTGMGTPSAAIIMEAVVKANPEAIIRTDLCGGLSIDHSIGDGFLADEAVVGDGCSSVYFGERSILSSHKKLTRALLQNAEDAEVVVHRGTIWTTDVLFLQTSELLESWIEEGGQAVDMESSIILGIGNRAGIPTACLNCISDLPVHGIPLFDEDVSPNLLTGLDRILDACLKTLVDWN